MEDTSHQNAVPGRGFFEVRSGKKSGGDDDIDIVFQGGNESLELGDRNGQIRVQEKYRIVGTFQDAGSDGSAFAEVFFE